MVAAPDYAQRHPDKAARLIQAHVRDLNTIPSIFVSVSLAAADPKLETQEAVERLADTFVEKNGWAPSHTEGIAGSLIYTHYGVFKRLVLHWIMWRAGVKTTTSQDYEYTDWEAVRALAERLMALVRAPVHA